MKRVLIANRGEIALRIIRSLREMDIETVAVYSDADQHAPHECCGFCHWIGAWSKQWNPTYVWMPLSKVLNNCKLRESIQAMASYRKCSLCRKSNASRITFIGPSPDSIRTMGSKLARKEVGRCRLQHSPCSRNSRSHH